MDGLDWYYDSSVRSVIAHDTHNDRVAGFSIFRKESPEEAAREVLSTLEGEDPLETYLERDELPPIDRLEKLNV